MSYTPPSAGRSRATSDPYTEFRERGRRQRRGSDPITLSDSPGPPGAMPRSSVPLSTLDTIQESHQSRKRSDSEVTLTEHVYDGHGDRKGKGTSAFEPAMPPRTYDSEGRSPRVAGRADYDRDYRDRHSMDDAQTHEYIRSQMPYMPHRHAPEHSYLPYHLNFSKKQKKSLGMRIKTFFQKLTSDPPIPSPAPSRVHSRQNSTVGLKSRPAFGQGLHETKRGEQENDMFIRAMDINGERDPQRADALDADVQMYPQPTGGKPHEIPLHGNHHQDQEDEKRQSGRNDNAMSAVSSNPGQLTGISYRDRRKKPKHRIVYNRDSESLSEIAYVTH